MMMIPWSNRKSAHMCFMCQAKIVEVGGALKLIQSEERERAVHTGVLWHRDDIPTTLQPRDSYPAVLHVAHT